MKTSDKKKYEKAFKKYLAERKKLLNAKCYAATYALAKYILSSDKPNKQ